MLSDPRIRLAIGLLVLAGAIAFVQRPLMRFAQRADADASIRAEVRAEAGYGDDGLLDGDCRESLAAAEADSALRLREAAPAPSNPFRGAGARIEVGPKVNPAGGAGGAGLATARESSSDRAPVLQGIVAGGRSSACIDGTIVSPGDTLAGVWVVERIDRHTVRLRGKGGRVLILEEP